jgi:hypothetical protein
MTQTTTELKPGDRMEDGTIYAGISIRIARFTQRLKMRG